MRAASIDLPAPGGPTNRRLCEPAAAISTARRAFHAAHVGEVAARRDRRDAAGLGHGQHLVALEVADQRDEVGCGHHRDRAGPGGLAALARGADQAEFFRRGAEGGREHARDGLDPPVEREFAEGCEPLHDVAGQHLHRREQPDRDRQVEMRALLLEVGGREIDQDALGRECEAHRVQRRADALARLADRLVRQPHDHEVRQPVADLHLDFDGHGLDADEREGVHAGDGPGARVPVGAAFVLHQNGRGGASRLRDAGASALVRTPGAEECEQQGDHEADAELAVGALGPDEGAGLVSPGGGRIVEHGERLADDDAVVQERRDTMVAGNQASPDCEIIVCEIAGVSATMAMESGDRPHCLDAAPVEPGAAQDGLDEIGDEDQQLHGQHKGEEIATWGPHGAMMPRAR
jgi:hypothetical protein